MEYGLAVAGNYDTVLAGARFASDRGLVALALPDHYLLALDDEEAKTTPAPDAFVQFGGLARETTDIELVMQVAPITFRHPGIIAKMAATIDEMSGGRLLLELPGHRVDLPLETGGCALLSVTSYYEWPDRKPENAMGHVRIWMGDKPLYEEAFSIQAEIIRDDYPPTYIAPGVGLPAMHNSYLNGDPVSYYRQSTGEPVSCPSADQAA